MKLLFTFFGRLEKCADKDGNPYPETDWRSAYVGPAGLVAVYESEHKAAGKKFACFFPDMPDQFTQDWLRTSAGELRVEEETYTITTRNSSYVFVRDEEALPGENKVLLFLNTGIVPQPVSEDEGPENREIGQKYHMLYDSVVRIE